MCKVFSNKLNGVELNVTREEEMKWVSRFFGKEIEMIAFFFD